MTDEKKDTPRMQSNSTSFLEPEQIRKQAEQKARDIHRADLDIMTREELRQMVNEFQVKQIEAELQNEQLRSQLEKRHDQAALFRIVTENMLDMVALTDMEGNFIFAGKSHEILGYEPDYLIGKNVMDFVYPDDLQHVPEEFAEFVSSGRPRRVEYRNRCKDGTYLWLETVGNFITGDKGKSQKIIFTSRDITERKQAEEALAHAYDLMRYIIEHANSAVAVHDRDLNYIYVSQQYLDIFQVKESDVIGRHHYDVFPDLPRKWRDVHQKVLAGEVFLKEKDSYPRKDGTLDWTRWECRPWYEADGTIGGIIVYTEIITERVTAEEALQANYKLLQIAGETAKFGGWTVDLENNICTWSDVVADIHDVPRGYSPPLQEGINFYAPEWRVKIKQVFSACAEKGVPYDEEMEIITQTGKRVRVRTAGKAVKDEKGRIIKVQGSFQDITERKQAEEALRESEKRYRTILNEMSEGYQEVDLSGNFTFFNEAFLNIFGYSRDEMMGTNFKHYAAEEAIAKRVYHLYNEMYKTGVPIQSCEWDIIRKDGQRRTLEFYASVVRDSADIPTGFRGIVRDITERQRAEKEREKLQAQLNQAQKMESVGRLAGGVAHDFNNKLSIINGYAELAMETIDPSDPLHETIQEIHTAGKKSVDIVRQLLAFARKQTISPVPLDLNDTIASMLKMLQRLIGENIDLAWHPGNNLWRVKIDPSQVDQVMANLAVNSKDAISDAGKLTIETKNIIVDEDYYRSNPEAIAGQYVMLAVSDNGCGMEKEAQDLMFEPFFTTKEIGKGTGLGLPTIYGIIKQNKGFINVYSEPGEGTTFKLYFPAYETEKSSVQSAKESGEQIPTGTETILVVEDEKTILQMARQILERLGYTVETAGSPAEALQISKQYDATIHLLIADVIMPDMNGRDLSFRLSKNHPGLKTLYMSGYTADVIAHHGVIDKGVQFIQKPFSLKDLAVKVREVIEQG